MKIKFLILLSGIIFCIYPCTLTADETPISNTVTPDAAWQQLMDGNNHYKEGALSHPRQNADRRLQTSQTQNPIAVVVSCSDSRVPPEIIFDQGVGDLFVVRAAGHLVDEFALGSAEYAVVHLGVKLIVVLGHERCGAVKAAVSAAKTGAETEGNIGALVDEIAPSVDAAAQKQTGDLLDTSIRKNVLRVVAEIKAAIPTAEVIGAYYDLDTGAVEKL